MRYYDETKKTSLFKCDLCHLDDLGSVINWHRVDMCGDCFNWIKQDDNLCTKPPAECAGCREC